MTGIYKISNLLFTGLGNDIPLTIDADTTDVLIYGAANTNLLDPVTPTTKLSLANRLVVLSGANLPGTVLHFDGAALATITIVEQGNLP